VQKPLSTGIPATCFGLLLPDSTTGSAFARFSSKFLTNEVLNFEIIHPEKQ
jgi:hypothetical protein